jgi:hypothetical protein
MKMEVPGTGSLVKTWEKMATDADGRLWVGEMQMEHPSGKRLYVKTYGFPFLHFSRARELVFYHEMLHLKSKFQISNNGSKLLKAVTNWKCLF